MSKSTLDRINYIVALITEFATAHDISLQQAYKYLQEFKGIDFVEKYYDVEHTFSFENTVEDLTALDEDYVTVYRDGDEIRFIWSHGVNVQEGFEILSFAADEGAVLVLQEVYAFDSNANPAPIDYHVDGV